MAAYVRAELQLGPRAKMLQHHHRHYINIMMIIIIIINTITTIIGIIKNDYEGSDNNQG